MLNYAGEAGKAGDGNTVAFTVGAATKTTRASSLPWFASHLVSLCSFCNHLGTVTGSNQILF